MCRLSKAMEKNGDQCIASLNTSINVQPNSLIKDKSTEIKEMIKCDKSKIIQEEDELPAELQHALHLSPNSGSNDNSAPQNAAQSNNTSGTSSEGSLTSASPQSMHAAHTHTHHHNYANHPHLHSTLNQHTNHDYHQEHQNHIHAGASLDAASGCNSTHVFSGMLLNSGGAASGSDDCECGTVPPMFLLPKNAAWMASSSSSLEEPTFFSSSIVNSGVTTPAPSDLSLMSTSMSKSPPTLHAQENGAAHHRTAGLPFVNNNVMQFMEAAGNFNHVADHDNASIMMSDPEYAHYANVPTFSSFLATSPSSCLQSEKGGASHHVDFLGASDGNSAAGGAECSMYESQLYGEDESGTYIQYQNASQAQNWPNVIHQESHDGAYACYWASTPQGMVPVMANASGGIAGTHTPSYVFNVVEPMHQPEHYYNPHQHTGAGQGATPMLTHSQSVPLGLEHFGSTHQTINMVNQRVQMALNGGNVTDGYGSSSMSEFRGGVRGQLRKAKDGSSCSNIMELEVDQGPHADHSWVDGHGQWRSGPHHMIKGTVRHSNKRPSPDGEDEESVHESAPPLKRSASWDSVGLYNNKLTTSPLNDHHMTSMNMNHMMKGSMSACKSTSPKQDKPRVRQGIANDPQSIAARHRRERISERLKILQQLVPNGSKVDLVTMLEKAINYVKFLQLQVKVLATDEYWPTPLNKFPKVAAMAKLAADSKEPANLEKVEKALAETIQATS